MIPTSIDGTDITGTTIDGTDVTEITVDGQTVFTAGPDIPDTSVLYVVAENYDAGTGLWPDQSGEGNDLSAVGDPQRVTGELNGEDVVRLDGDDFFDGPGSSSWSVQQPFMTVGVVRNPNSNSSQMLADAQGGSPGSGRITQFLRHGDNQTEINAGTALRANNQITDYQILSCVYDGSNSIIRQNKTQQTSGNAGSGDWTEGLRLGADSNGGLNLDGEIVEYLIIDERDLTKLQSQEDRLDSKYGITL